MKKFLTLIKKHKIITGLIILALVVAGFFVFKTINSGKASETKYYLGTVEKGTLITSVSGSGQVSVAEQIDIKPKVSGDITYVGVTKGQQVSKGDIIAKIDSTDALRAVRDAEDNLETAKLSMDKLNEPASELTIMQAENALTNANESKIDAEASLKKAYDDGFNTVANSFLELPTIMTGLNDILLGYSYLNYQKNLDYYADAVRQYDVKVVQYRNDAETKYNSARTAYDKNFQNYKSASRYSDTETIKNLIAETYETVRSIAESIKSTNNLIQFYEDKLIEYHLKPATTADTHLSTLSTYTSKTNSQLSSLLSIKTTIENDEKAIIDAERTIKEKTISLENLKEGPDVLDVRSQELTIKQKEYSLSDAKAALADYSVRATFDGIIADLSAKKGDAASTGTALVTLITKQKIAEITLNEIDVAKVKIGQKTTLTFDVIEDLSITGEVVDIDSIGTVSQGVVSYTVKISFDTEEEKVKPGMTVSASIITEAKQDVLLVSNSAIKSSVNVNYVEVLDSSITKDVKDNAAIASKNFPTQKQIIIGSQNDSYTEITSGLSEGDRVIIKTSTGTSTKTTNTNSSTINSQKSILQEVGGPGGGMMR